MRSNGTKSESMIQTEPPISTVDASSSSSQLPLSPPWIELPDDLMANILQRLGVAEILLRALYVCATWWRVCQSPAMWRFIHLDRHGYPANEFDCIFYRAVDRSLGQLIELKLFGFHLDALLCYAAERYNSHYSLGLLEELHLVILPWLTAEDFESIGIACPMLKSFTYYNDWVGYPEFTEHAVAIGKNMPNLRHFRLYSHNIENKGLEAILDGCPNLESLHLRKCFGLDLQGVLDIDYEHEYDHIDSIWPPS
ncbi:putative F-box/LRR-repeat protein 23 [Salvia hispanica]|uniref:putative F-box/LRR-repeat protein 23 n=1 Tax=Salvia hispanica TaxID=49212 RepID=UPI0020098CDD|nr:putative F-box/LRR-repeat protein 23 [Salvia hispanica]